MQTTIAVADFFYSKRKTRRTVYRDRIEIMYDILVAIKKNGLATKAQIQRGEYIQTTNYLRWAVASNLVLQEEPHLYSITKHGIRFIELIEELKTLLNGVTSFPTATRYT